MGGDRSEGTNSRRRKGERMDHHLRKGKRKKSANNVGPIFWIELEPP